MRLVLSTILIGSLLPAALAGAVPREIPFTLKGHAICVRVAIDDCDTLGDFIVDTGAMTALDTRAAVALGLGEGAPVPTLPGMLAVHLARQRVALTIGGLRFGDQLLPVLDLSLARRCAEKTVAGLLGSDLLCSYVVRVDYRRQLLTVADAGDTSLYPGGGIRLPFVPHVPTRAPLVRCRLGGLGELAAMIDTGSPFPVAAPLALLERPEARTVSPLVFSRGVIHEWPLGALDHNAQGLVHPVHLGSWAIDALPVLFANTAGQVLLGAGLLRECVLVIDYPHRQVVVAPYADAQVPRDLFSAGLALQRESSGATTVRGIWKGSPADTAAIPIGAEVLSLNGREVRGSCLSALHAVLDDDAVPVLELVLSEARGHRLVRLPKVPLLGGSLGRQTKAPMPTDHGRR